MIALLATTFEQNESFNQFPGR